MLHSTNCFYVHSAGAYCPNNLFLARGPQFFRDLLRGGRANAHNITADGYRSLLFVCFDMIKFHILPGLISSDKATCFVKMVKMIVLILTSDSA